MLEIHDVAGLPLGQDPGVDPCRKGLEKTSCLVTWPNHINLNFLTSFASRILAPMMSLIPSRIDWLVRRSWYVTPKSRRKHFISNDEILLIDEAGDHLHQVAVCNATLLNTVIKIESLKPYLPDTSC